MSKKNYNWRKWKDFQLDGLNESYNDEAAKKVADNFTRYVLGDPDSAINDLKRLKNKIGVDVSTLGADQHGEAYSKLYNELYKVLKKHIKSLD